MTRKEETLGYCGENNYKPFSVEACTAIKAIEWADQHPRKGLWDSEKVTSFIKENVREYHKSGVFHVDDFIRDLRKAMED